MLTAGDFKNGVTFEMEGKVYQVIEFQHVKPGKGAAFVRTKYRDVMTGAIREQSFNPTAKFENAVIERRELQYSYDDGDLYHFMDTESWEETLISRDMVGDNFKFVKEEMMCKIQSYKGKVFSVEPPTSRLSKSSDAPRCVRIVRSPVFESVKTTEQPVAFRDAIVT